MFSKGPLKARHAVLVAVLLIGGSWLRGDDGRVARIGAQLICTCGCTQNAMTCNHVGCTVVTQMQAEIRARAASTDSDDLVLQSFVQEYGTQVLANPTTKGFNRVAWIMPWVGLGIGLMLVLLAVKRWRRAAHPAAAAPMPIGAELRAEIDAEVAAAAREWRT